MKQKIVVLAYHSIADGEYEYSTSPADFERQLLYIKKHFTIIRRSQLQDVIDHKTPGDFAVITFDDGLQDNFENALPILKKLNIPATIFVTSGLVEKTLSTRGGELPMMSWSQIQEAAHNDLIEIGSHTNSHVDMAVAEETTVIDELRKSKEILMEKTGQKIVSFSYPKGRTSDSASRIVTQFFDMAFIGNGIIKNGLDVYSIPRIVVRNKTPWWKFILKLSNLYWKYNK